MTSDTQKHLDETLFGAKTAISAVLLGRQLGINIKAARESLEQFYQAHRDELTASYCIKSYVTSSDLNVKQSTIRIVDSKELEGTGTENALIYSVSPSNAYEPAVISDLNRAVQKVDITKSIEDLKELGVIVNPILTSLAVEASRGPPAEKVPVKTASTITKPQVKTEEKPKPKMETLPAKTSASKPTPPAKAQSKAKSPFNFTKATKEEVHAQAFKAPTNRVVSEKVVVADAVSDNEESEEDEDSKATREAEIKSRNEQMKKLGNLFDDEDQPMEPAPASEATNDQDEGAMIIDEESEEEHEPEHRLTIEEDLVPQPDILAANDESPEEPAAEEEEAESAEPTPGRKLVEETRHEEGPDGMIVSYKVKVWKDISPEEQQHQSEKRPAPALVPKKPAAPAKLPAIPKRKTGQATLTSFFTKPKK